MKGCGRGGGRACELEDHSVSSPIAHIVAYYYIVYTYDPRTPHMQSKVKLVMYARGGTRLKGSYVKLCD